MSATLLRFKLFAARKLQIEYNEVDLTVDQKGVTAIDLSNDSNKFTWDSLEGFIAEFDESYKITREWG